MTTPEDLLVDHLQWTLNRLTPVKTPPDRAFEEVSLIHSRLDAALSAYYKVKISRCQQEVVRINQLLQERNNEHESENSGNIV
jgi:hypothetical protein